MPSACAHSWISVRNCAFAGTPASTTIRLAFGSHHPPADPSIASKDTEYPSDSANPRRGASRCACESPVNGWRGGSSGAGSTPSSTSVWETSNTNAVLNTTRRSSVSSPV